MPRRWIFYGLAVLLLIGFAAQSPKAEVELTVNPFGTDSLAGIVDRHRGEPFILAFWSTQCGICIAEMAVWRELRDAQPDFRVVLVSTDRDEDAERAKMVLRRQGMTVFENWRFDDPIPARVRASVDAKWRGELPRLHLYDAGGRLTVHRGMLSKEDALAWWAQSNS